MIWIQGEEIKSWKQLFKSFSARWKLSAKNMCSKTRKEGICRTTSRKRQMAEPIELSPSNDSNSTDFEINGTPGSEV